MVTPGQVLCGLEYEVVPPASHSLLITSVGGGSHSNENGPHHKSRFDQVHPGVRPKDGKHTDNLDCTIHYSKHQIRLDFKKRLLGSGWRK